MTKSSHPQAVRPAYDLLYLSPHLDDAALSCGGQIVQHTQAGRRVMIVTVTAGEPALDATGHISDYARSLHDRWDLLADAVAGRRAEDVAACAILGADFLHLDLADCIYRMHPETGQPFYVSDADLFGPVHAAEEGVVAWLAGQFEALPRAEQIVVPLGVGNHVDHQLTRQAAERVWGVAGLIYYEDYPYAQKSGAVETIVGGQSGRWRSQAIPLTPTALAAKIQSILAFRSQISTFWSDEADLRVQVAGFAAQGGGEKNWTCLA